jgi:hypothetical protein
MPKRASEGGARLPPQPLPTPSATGVTTTLSGKYQARIKIKGKRYDLGSYDTIEEAMDVYANAKHTGEPERGYLKRETKQTRIARGTGAFRPACPAHDPAGGPSCLHATRSCSSLAGPLALTKHWAAQLAPQVIQQAIPAWPQPGATVVVPRSPLAQRNALPTAQAVPLPVHVQHAIPVNAAARALVAQHQQQPAAARAPVVLAARIA